MTMRNFLASVVVCGLLALQAHAGSIAGSVRSSSTVNTSVRKLEGETPSDAVPTIGGDEAAAVADDEDEDSSALEDNLSAGDEEFGEAEMPFDPPDLDSRTGSSNPELPLWATASLIASGGVLFLSCLFLGAVRHARNTRPLSINNVIAEEEWIRPYSHDPMYSSRPMVNVVDFGDSLTDKKKPKEKKLSADDRFSIS